MKLSNVSFFNISFFSIFDIYIDSMTPQFIYIIPDGINIVSDKYKIFKIDIKPYIRTLLPKKRNKK